MLLTITRNPDGTHTATARYRGATITTTRPTRAECTRLAMCGAHLHAVANATEAWWPWRSVAPGLAAQVMRETKAASAFAARLN